jgi:hypothetical protein
MRRPFDVSGKSDTSSFPNQWWDFLATSPEGGIPSVSLVELLLFFDQNSDAV